MKEIKLHGLDMNLYLETLDNGLDIIMLPYTNKKNYFVSYCTKYGSEITNFIPVGEKKEIKVPDGIAHFLEHKMFEQEDGIDPFTLETPLFEFEKTKKGKKIYDLIMKIVVNTSNTDKIKNQEERELVEKNNRFMLALIPKNSLRSLSQSSSGMLPVNLAKALLELANGHVLKALVELIFRG